MESKMASGSTSDAFSSRNPATFTILDRNLRREVVAADMRRMADSGCRCCLNFCREFKTFALRGNVLDLAIGIIIGTAFTHVVQSLVDDVITPPFGLILGGVDFSNLTIKMKNFVYKNQPPVVIRYGKFIQALISLIIIAMALFFIIKGINQLHRITSKSKDKNQKSESLIQVNEEVQVLREIRDILAQQTSREPRSISL